MSAPDRLHWHRLFGIALVDRFTGTPWHVELEKELALKSQRLDAVIIERCRPHAAEDQALALPDGLEGLRAHNVLTYKSLHEPLDAWALEELIGHYVNYRKLVSGTGPSADSATRPGADDNLLPAQDFQLYAVATRAPRKLFAELPRQAWRTTPWPGVYDIDWGVRRIRLIVLTEVAKHPRNAPWELFSTELARLHHGLAHYQPRSNAAGELLYRLYLVYRLELPEMSYTVEEFIRETHREVIAHLTPEERRALLAQMPPEERLRGLPPEERLRGLPLRERLRNLDPDELAELDPEERELLRKLMARDD